jgi:hypothetical protein
MHLNRRLLPGGKADKKRKSGLDSSLAILRTSFADLPGLSFQRSAFSHEQHMQIGLLTR